MQLTPSVRRFWGRFLEMPAAPRDASARLYEVFRIGDSAAAADEGAALILSGEKTTTSSLLWEYEARGEAPPSAGTLSILTDGSDHPLAVVESIEVEVRPFDRIDAAFAYDYGEWDRTLETWRRECRGYYARQCEELGRIAADDMPLVCERLRVIYRVG